MDIYDLLNRIIVNRRYELSSNLFSDNYRGELDDEEKEIFDLLKNISSLGTKISNKGIEFHPMLILADGKRSFSIEDLNEEDYLKLKQLELGKIPLVIQALVADILWIKKKEFYAAQIAADAYWQLFTLWYNDDDNIGTLDMLRRAVCISVQTKQTEIYDEIQKWFNDFLIKKAAK